MKAEAGNQVHALTSENLKKFEEQLKSVENLHGRRNIPQRTAGDGESEQHSAPSLYGEHDDATEGKHELEKPRTQRTAQRSFYRPERDLVRRNPDGRSQNESNPGHSLSIKTINYDEEDYYIPYEDPNYFSNKASSQMSKHEILYEISSATSSTVTPVRTKTVKKPRSVTSEDSIPSSSSVDSDDGVFDEDDFITDYSSDESTYEIETTVANMTPSVYASSFSSSDSVSSIATHPSKQENSVTPSLSRPLETPILSPSPTAGKKQVESGNLKDASAAEDPLENSLEKILEQDLGSIENKTSSQSTKNGLSVPSSERSRKRNEAREIPSRTESSITPGSTREAVSRGTTSRKDSLIAIEDLSSASYVSIRNWSRWSPYSEGGYSITSKILPPKHLSGDSSALSSASESPPSNSSSSSSSYRGASEFRSPNLNLAKSPRSLHLDDDNSSISQDNTISSMSMPNLKPRLPDSVSLEVNVMASGGTRTKGKAKKETENDVEGFNFKYRTKKIPKLRDRPERPSRKRSPADAVSSQPSHQYAMRRRRRKKEQGLSPLSRNQDEQSVISLSSYSASLRRRAAQSVTTVTESTRRKLKSSVSMTTESSASTSSTSNSQRRRRGKSNQLRPLNVDDSGFVSDHPPSSCASIRPVDTPFTPYLRNRYASQQSIDSEYSSYDSIYQGSASSHGSVSSLSLSSHSEGESTAVGPEVNAPPPKSPAKKEAPKTKPKPKRKQKKQERKEEKLEERDEKPAKEKVAEEEKEEPVKPVSPKVVELPPVIPPPQHQRRKSSPYHSSLSPALIVRMKALRNDITQLAKRRHKKRACTYKKVVRVNHPLPSFQEAYRDRGMPRLIKLARPKESKAVWATSFWPVRWGDQTMVFPMSKAALKAKGTPRLEQLAIAKKDFRKDHPEMCGRDAFQFSCGRPSVILEVSPLAMRGEASARVVELAKHKTTMQAFEERAQRDTYIFSCGRTSPIWNVSEGAKTSEERERTMSLAQPKKTHPQYQPEKPCMWPVSSAARKASPSPRIEQLARPKTRSEGLHREPMWAVSSTALRTVASARVQELAKAKQTAEGYEPCKELDEPIPRSVLRASATERIKSLSKPIIRETMDHVQFNPDAFKVSPAALKGRMPERIAELAQPLSRR